MQQHPIPQNVTAYEFHLIGNMTLKQFIEMGVGVGIGVLFYSTSLPDLVKWPLVILPVIIGAAMAFLPFDGRPLDRMIIIFFKAVYAPTQYIWRKEPKIPAYFTFTAKQTQLPDPLNLERQRLRKNLNEYLATLPQKPTDASLLDTQETETLNQYSYLFETSQVVAPVTKVEEIYIPQPKVRVRKMRSQEEITQHDTEQLSQSLRAVAVSVPEIENAAPPVAVAEAITSTVYNPSFTSEDFYELPEAKPQALPEDMGLVDATSNLHLPFPATPSQPNTLVGMVITPNGMIIENAVVEIKDSKGAPIRALLTNQLGQFFSTSPLYNGDYILNIRKPGYTFDNVSITLNNTIVAPLEIKAK